MTRSKQPVPKRSVAGRRLAGAMREVQALEFARRVREVREGLGLAIGVRPEIRVESSIAAGMGASAASAGHSSPDLPARH